MRLLPVYRGFWWVCVVALFIVLFIASSQVSYVPQMFFTWQDKVQHFVFFAAWGFCFHRAIHPANWRQGLLWTVVFCALNGALDEWHQTFTPGRSGNDPFDWTADVLGGCFAGLLGALFIRQSPARIS